MLRATKTGFTVIELLVTLTVIALLMALLLPAVQSAREAARRIQCTNNLKQLGLVLQQYEGSYSVYPASMYLTAGKGTAGIAPNWIGGWSVNGRILSFMEQNSASNAINFSLNLTDPSNQTVTGLAISAFICPSDVNPQPYQSSYGTTAVSTVGWCMGDWYVWGGFGGLPNRTAFGPNVSRRIAEFRDGLSSTLIASEIRSLQSVRVNCNELDSLNSPGNPLPPDYPVDSITAQLGSQGSPCTLSDSGHTSWADGSVNETGMTSALQPNTKVSLSVHNASLSASAGDADLDLESTPETSGGPTFAAITSRSYHPGGVNGLFGDGSVHFLKASIDGNVWRSLSSVNGSEIISADQY